MTAVWQSLPCIRALQNKRTFAVLYVLSFSIIIAQPFPAHNRHCVKLHHKFLLVSQVQIGVRRHFFTIIYAYDSDK